MSRRPALRVATSDDASAIARIRVDSWRAAYAGIVPARILERMDAAAFAPRLALRLGGADHGTLVAQAAGGAVVGFVIAGPSRDEDARGAGEIEAIYLAPGARGRGIGAALLEAACASLADRGFGNVVLWVLTANAPARRFYERHGFARDGGAQMLDFDGTPIEEIRYRRAVGRSARGASEPAIVRAAVPSPAMDLPPAAALSDRVREFLERPLYPTLATVGADGTPHQAVIWYRLEPDGRILVNSRSPRRWPDELRRTGRASLAVTDLDDPMRWVGLQLAVEDVIDDVAVAREDIVALAVRYEEDDDESIASFRTQARISFRLRITAVHDHLEE